MVTIEDKPRQLKNLVKKLEKIRGRHTELVSVYVPAGYSLIDVMNQLKQEQSTAVNIKSKTTRKNVLGTLEKIIQHLKIYKKTPDNGLAIFSGNISEREGVTDIGLWAIEPPEPLANKLYRCDQEFVLEPLKELTKEKEVYGLLVIDKSEASIGLLEGKKVTPIKHITSLVPSKTAAGGWSQKRYSRIREGMLNDFLKRIGEIASKIFGERKGIIGIIIGGPGPLKEEFYNGDFLQYEIQKKVIGVVDTGYTNEYGLGELVERSGELLANTALIKERKTLEKFFTELKKDSGLAVYGYREVKNALQSGALEKLFLSEDFDYFKLKLNCEKCKYEIKTEAKTTKKFEKCPKCGSDLKILEKEELFDIIREGAERVGTEVKIISTSTREGVQLKELGGIAGLLRYKTN